MNLLGWYLQGGAACAIIKQRFSGLKGDVEKTYRKMRLGRLDSSI